MGHWYDREGVPMHYIPSAKSGELRPTTLRDARKLRLFPSVSTIIGDVIAKPFVDRWKRQKYLDHAIEIARANKNITPEQVIGKAHEAFEDEMKEVTGRGDEIHNMFENALSNEGVDIHIHQAYDLVNRELGYHEWVCEKSHTFAGGYAGKPDAYCDLWTIDFKTKDLTESSTADKVAYDENIMQLAAYNRGLGGGARVANVFIDRNDPSLVLIKVWTPEEEERGWQMFNAAFNYWKQWKKFFPEENL